MDNSLLLRVLSDPSTVVLDTVYVVLASSSVHPAVEKFGVCITLFEVGMIWMWIKRSAGTRPG